MLPVEASMWGDLQGRCPLWETFNFGGYSRYQ